MVRTTASSGIPSSVQTIAVMTAAPSANRARWEPDPFGFVGVLDMGGSVAGPQVF